ncbi:ATP-binding protein [Saccharicrinis carchari]|nr:ATP-binding protein [Saccharicrinis carchari]
MFIKISVFVLFIVCLLGVFHYFAVKKALINEIRGKQLITDLKASQSSLQSILEKSIITAELLASDSTIIQWFIEDEKDEELRNQILSKLDWIKKVQSFAMVSIVNKSTNHYWKDNNQLFDSISDSDPDDRWFFKFIKEKEKIAFHLDFTENLGKTLLFINVMIGDITEPVGVASVAFDPSILISEFEQYKFSPNSKIWLINQEGIIKLSENRNEYNKSIYNFLPDEKGEYFLNRQSLHLLPEIKFNGESYEVAVMPLGKTKHTIIMLVPHKDLVTVLKVIKSNTIWLGLFFLLLTIFLSYSLAKNLTVPITRIGWLTNRLAKGNLDQPIDDSLTQRNDEIGDLSRSVKSMQIQLSKTIESLKFANERLADDKINLTKLNAELEQAIVKVSKSERLTKSFLSNISHEIRTPMNCIIGFSQVLELEDHSREFQLKYIKQIINGGHELLEIINHLVHMSKIESEFLQPQIVAIDINKFFGELYSSFYDRVEKRGLKLSHIPLATNFTEQIHTDPLLLKQVFNELLNNAIKNTDKGEVKYGCEVANDTIKFYVSDTGRGIPDHQKQIIFEPFVKIHNDQTLANSGVGLGLSISKKIMGAFGGDIWVETLSNETVFIFSLPYECKGIK